MAVDPARQIEMGRPLARDVLALAQPFPPEWDGGNPGYLAAGMCGLAEDIIAASEDRP
jgi:hypothetical protein